MASRRGREDMNCGARGISFSANLKTTVDNETPLLPKTQGSAWENTATSELKWSDSKKKKRKNKGKETEVINLHACWSKNKTIIKSAFKETHLFEQLDYGTSKGSGKIEITVTVLCLFHFSSCFRGWGSGLRSGGFTLLGTKKNKQKKLDKRIKAIFKRRKSLPLFHFVFMIKFNSNTALVFFSFFLSFFISVLLLLWFNIVLL